MAQRISRAKQQIKASGIPFELPPEPERADAPARRAARALPDLQRGLHGDVRARPAARRARPSRRSGSPATCDACCRTTARWPGCSRSCCSPTRGAPARTRADGTPGPARRAGPEAVEPRATSRRASRSSPTPWRRRRSGPTSCRRRSPRSTTRRPQRAGHRLAADPRPLRAARAHRAQPDGHAQPRRRGGDGARPAGRARAARPRSTTTTASPSTTASTRSAPTCSRWPATTRRPARATGAAARRTTSLPEQRYLEARAARLIREQ